MTAKLIVNWQHYKDNTNPDPPKIVDTNQVQVIHEETTATFRNQLVFLQVHVTKKSIKAADKNSTRRNMIAQQNAANRFFLCTNCSRQILSEYAYKLGLSLWANTVSAVFE